MTTGEEHLPAWRGRHAKIQASIFTLLVFKAKALNLCLWSKAPQVLHPHVQILAGAVRSCVTAELGLSLPTPLTSPKAAELSFPSLLLEITLLRERTNLATGYSHRIPSSQNNRHKGSSLTFQALQPSHRPLRKTSDRLSNLGTSSHQLFVMMCS